MVFKAVTMKNAVFWDLTPRGFCMKRRFGGKYRLHHQGEKNQQAQLLVTALLLAR
jgi:tRNA splicing endonuclease